MVPVKSPIPTYALSAPVGHVMRPTLTCAAEDSLQRAVVELRRNGGGLLPIVQDGVLAGAITEFSISRALANGVEMETACLEAADQATTVAPYSSGAEALRLLEDDRVQTLIVVDDLGKVTGILSPSDLIPRRRMLPRPEPVGGMATPFGVYLTSGGLSGGVSLWAVMGTGALMFTMLAISQVIAIWMLTPLDHTTLTDSVKDAIAGGFTLFLFGLTMRLMPLSGTHGAEHMVVHAMEKGEELTPDIVARMPRVHPRCGTNLAVALTLFSVIATTEWVKSFETRLLVAALVTMFLWRPLGSMAQQFVTTKKPNAKQLRSGIKAANELIERYSTAKVSTASIPRRIWNSGLLHVISGSTLTLLATKGVLWAFHLKIPGLE